MTDRTRQVAVVTVEAGEVQERSDALATQISVTICVNGEDLITVSCSPDNTLQLAYGYLITQGLLMWDQKPPFSELNNGVIHISLDEDALPQKPLPVRSDYTATADTVLKLVSEFSVAGEVFGETGGTHSSALGVSGTIKCFVEDVSRFASLEKTVGNAYIEGIDVQNSCLILSSRVNSTMIEKATRAGIPAVAAVSAPTAQAAEEAQRLGICLCGFVRGERMNVYSCRWRLGL